MIDLTMIFKQYDARVERERIKDKIAKLQEDYENKKITVSSYQKQLDDLEKELRKNDEKVN